MNWINDIKEFQTAFGLGIKPTPEFPDNDTIHLRRELISEEILELRVGETNRDMVETADAIVDCMYVLLGTACEYGLIDRIDELWNRVHESNMSKVGPDGKVLRREDGKILKPETFKKVVLDDIINRQ